MKKLLTTLLSVLMLCTLATTNVFAETDYEKIGDILATAPNLPDNNNSVDCWQNEKGDPMYIYHKGQADQALGVSTSYTVPCSTSVTKVDDKTYTAVDNRSYIVNFTFHLNDEGNLISVDMVFETTYSWLSGTFTKPDYKQTILTHEVTEGYEWTVPATTAISAGDADTEITGLEVTKCILGENKNLKISVKSANSFYLKLDSSNSVSYQLFTKPSTETRTAIGFMGGVVINTNEAVAQTLYAKLSGNATKAGSYSDTLTFTATVVDAN